DDVLSPVGGLCGPFTANAAFQLQRQLHFARPSRHAGNSRARKVRTSDSLHLQQGSQIWQAAISNASYTDKMSRLNLSCNPTHSLHILNRLNHSSTATTHHIRRQQQRRGKML